MLLARAETPPNCAAICKLFCRSSFLRIATIPVLQFRRSANWTALFQMRATQTQLLDECDKFCRLVCEKTSSGKLVVCKLQVAGKLNNEKKHNNHNNIYKVLTREESLLKIYLLIASCVAFSALRERQRVARLQKRKVSARRKTELRKFRLFFKKRQKVWPNDGLSSLRTQQQNTIKERLAQRKTHAFLQINKQLTKN